MTGTAAGTSEGIVRPMTHTHHLRSTATGPAPATSVGRGADPARQAFLILRSAFTVAPIVFGADKFFHLLVNWDRYLSPTVADLSPFTVHQTMAVVGVIEVVAGAVVAVAPRIGAPVVSLWLLGVVGNLLLLHGYLDVALRDVGLLLASLALWRLATVYSTRTLWPAPRRS